MKKYFALVCMCHFALLIFTLRFNSKIEVRLPPQPYLTAYVFHSQTHPVFSKQGIKPTYKASLKQVSQAQRDKSQAVADNKLLQLLHEAISRVQNYPEEAALLRQSGTATISLVLNPNGIISHVSLLKSSGFSTLDQAALQAVQSLHTLSAAKLFITEEKSFDVPVMFEL